MAQFFTDFEEYTVGDELTTDADWTDIWAGGLSLDVIGDGGDNTINVIGGGSRDAAYWNQIPEVADAEVYMEVTMGSDDDARTLLRADPTVSESNADGYVHGERPSSSVGGGSGGRILYRYNDGNFQRIAVTEPSSGSLSIRARVSGSNQFLRVWDTGTTEPVDWDLEATDSNVTGDGVVGIFAFDSTDYTLHSLGVGTEGDTAPTSPVGGTAPAAPTNLQLSEL